MIPTQQSPTKRGRRHRWTTLVPLLVLTLGMVFSPSLAAQDATETPDPDNIMVPGTGDESAVASPSVDATEEATPTEESTALLAPASDGLIATDPGHPAVLAHGLSYLSGSQVVWQVREVEPEEAASATAETSNASVVYQVSGSSVIRNNITGKRALLNPGEAYFKAGGDPYTTMANSTGSVVWIYEIVGATDVASDAFYESPLIDDYQEGVFDLQMVRYVLEPGDSAPLPVHTGPALVISTNGDIDIEAESVGLLATGDGQLVTGDGIVVNNSQDPVDYTVLMLGEEVSDASSAPATGTQPPPGQGSDETPASSDETLPGDSDSVTPVPEDSGDTGVGGDQESINISANVELYVVVVADGVTVFDGPIPAGGQSGEIIGSTFEVYTSNGGQTVFTNSCGEEFLMGFETGEARYTLTADGTSCLG